MFENFCLKVMRIQLELGQIRQEIDKRIHEKEEEFELTRLNHQRALESIQASLESEAKGKIDAIRQKKKLEGDINELEISLDHSNRVNADSLKSIKRLSLAVDELQTQIEDEQRQRDEAKEAVLEEERKCALLVDELEEIRNSLDASERARKATENDLHEAADRISELNAVNANLVGVKRKLDNELVAVQADLEEAVVEVKLSEEKVRKSSDDANRLAEELRLEQVRYNIDLDF